MVNFARLYPRYRDLAYLATYMARWDQAILALLPHSRCRLPACLITRPSLQSDFGRAASVLPGMLHICICTVQRKVRKDTAVRGCACSAPASP